MKNERDNKGFFDKNTFLAIGLSFAVFFLWQLYVSKKYPQADKAATPVAASPNAAPAAAGGVAPVAGPAATSPAPTGVDPQKPSSVTAVPVARSEFKEQTLTYNSPKVMFELSSDGMGLKNLVLKEFTDRQNGPVTYKQDQMMPLAATIINDARNFTLEKIADNAFAGKLSDNGIEAVKTITVDSEHYIIKTKIVVKSAESKKIRVATYLQGQVYPVSSTFLLPSYEHQEFFVLGSDEKKHRTKLDPETAHKSTYESASIAAFDSQYFALALANRSPLIPRVQAESAAKTGGLSFEYETPQPVTEHEFAYDFYFGPKNMDALKAIDDELTKIVDFGFFGFIGKPLHWILKFLHGFLFNWGLAIIVLTILIRTVLLPMNVYSFRAMRKMQKIQPKLKEIKEKYKNDPTRINQETLQLMRTEKANPLSGCIPALMQIPIFLALYPMIGNSFELYKEPFFLWITDLTLKDQFYVLPVLAGLVFFLQTKMTPTPNMDPAQQKVMLIMPIFLSLFMLSAPSGLALYMLVNSLYGFGQQMVFMKDRTT